MITFIRGSQLSHELENMITNADEYLCFISPYIKLSDRIKSELKKIISKDNVQLIIIYGKNEDQKSKSLSTEDKEFLKEFPNIKIGYEKILHAKYYASEDFSILCSMNLHEFSQNNNIEAGVKMKPINKYIFGEIPNILGNVIKDFKISRYDAEVEAHNYFYDVVKNAEIEFEKKPVYEKTFLGINPKYLHSEIIIDNTESNNENKLKLKTKTNGYCIRTGVEIPFDEKKPFCYEAFKSWNQYQNKDFKENYCHKTGVQSFGKTSMKNPIL